MMKEKGVDKRNNSKLELHPRFIKGLAVVT